MRRGDLILATLAAAMLTAAPAAAHTPYLVPTTFAPDRDYVDVEAGVSEGGFFIPDFPIRGEGDFIAVSPSGEATVTPVAATLKELAMLEVALPQEGTWRISTGARAGRAGQWAKIDGVWRSVRLAGAPARPPRPAATAGGGQAARGPGGEGEEGEVRLGPVEASEVPAGAETMTTQSFQTAETFVTRGAPSTGALKPTGKGFEFAPETHPNEVYAGEPFKFGFLADGVPAAGAAFSLSKAGDVYAEVRYSNAGVAGADGKAQVTFADPGVYVLEARYPATAPGAGPVAKSYRYVLTFEVTR